MDFSTISAEHTQASQDTIMTERKCVCIFQIEFTEHCISIARDALKIVQCFLTKLLCV